MVPLSVEKLYEKYYAGDKARQELFDVLASWHSFEKVLYPGGFIHVNASFVFPSVTYVDNNGNAKRFFSQMEDVLALVNQHKVYPQGPKIVFHGIDYEKKLDEPKSKFDLLVSLYAGFISKPCKRYLKVGGVLAVNNSHGDAGLASIDPDYKLVGVVQGRGNRLRVSEAELHDYFKPKKSTEITEQFIRRLGRGIGYTKTAVIYLFERVH